VILDDATFDKLEEPSEEEEDMLDEAVRDPPLLPFRRASRKKAQIAVAFGRFGSSPSRRLDNC
jgi:hypothetical protein